MTAMNAPEQVLRHLPLLDHAKAPAQTKVVVAMSGGVDSSVVAALLKSQGYDVIGITLQLYDHGAATHRTGSCCAGQDIYDARRVADRIGIPHYVLDYESRFRDEVIEKFAESYLAGETPIPCVECNRTVKFRDLLKLAQDLGADMLATGHYVISRDLGDGRRGLFRARDASRDQSYFLYATTPEQLAMLRFPLGDLPKSQTRDLAAAFGLEIADKPDSQDICFVPQGRYADVIERLKPGAARAGEIVDLEGRVLGHHAGILNFTVGQRKGIGVAASEALYVVRLDADAARVVVGPRAALATRSFCVRDLNWIGELVPEDWPAEGLEVAARVRSTRHPKPALLKRAVSGSGNSCVVELFDAEEGVAPGQACVLYDSDRPDARVLGGGIIRANLIDAPSHRTAA